MSNKYKILALFGKSGAGKDTIQKWLVGKQNIHSIVSCTTRPPRENEIDGVDYHFLTEDEFYQLDMLECTKFNDWQYGTPKTSLSKNKINVGVFNIRGIKLLLKDERVEILPIYIYCSDIIRLSRSLGREINPDCHEICRRFLADEEDFKNISFKYIIFNNGHLYDEYFGILELPEVKEFIKDVNN